MYNTKTSSVQKLSLICKLYILIRYKPCIWEYNWPAATLTQLHKTVRYLVLGANSKCPCEKYVFHGGVFFGRVWVVWGMWGSDKLEKLSVFIIGILNLPLTVLVSPCKVKRPFWITGDSPRTKLTRSLQVLSDWTA